MRQKDRQFYLEESRRYAEYMFSRFAQAKEIFPWLRPHLNHSQLRRTVARLRSGAIPSIDSRIPAHVLADILEGAIEQDLMIREVVADMDKLTELERRLRRR